MMRAGTAHQKVFMLRTTVQRLCLCLCILLLAAKAMAQYAGEPQLYRNKTEGFSLKVPAQWEMKDRLEPPAVLLTKSPLEHFNNDFREEMELRKIPAHNGTLLTFNAWIAQMKTSHETFAEVVRGRGKIGPNGADWIVYTMHHWGYDVKCLAYYFNSGDAVYILICTSVQDAYEKYESVFRETATTFRMR